MIKCLDCGTQYSNVLFECPSCRHAKIDKENKRALEKAESFLNPTDNIAKNKEAETLEIQKDEHEMNRSKWTQQLSQYDKMRSFHLENKNSFIKEYSLEQFDKVLATYDRGIARLKELLSPISNESNPPTEETTKETTENP